MEKDIENIINSCSVYLCLKYNFISCEDILKYLLCNKVSTNTMICYKFICQFNKEQIINNDYFYKITKDIEYKTIYNIIVNESKDLENVTEEILCICDIYFNTYSFFKYDKVIFKARSEILTLKLFGSINSNWYKLLIENDNLKPLQLYEFSRYEKLLIQRCLFLKEKCNSYWNNIARNEYKNIINIDNVDFNYIREYNLLFEDIFTSNYIENVLYYKIKKLPLLKQGYLLGFPIYDYLPTKKDIDEKLLLLKEIGVNKYCKLISEKNKEIINNKLEYIKKFNLGNTDEKENIVDRLYNNIIEYNISDLIFLYISNTMYIYSRSEFTYILKTKKDIYLNTPISKKIEKDIQLRNAFFKLNQLPNCKPLKDLLNEYKEKDIFELPIFNIMENLGLIYNPNL